MTSDSLVRSREEDEELQRSTKKVKETHRGKAAQEPHGLGTREGEFRIKKHLLESCLERSSKLLTSIMRWSLMPHLMTSLRTYHQGKLLLSSLGFHFLRSRLTSMWKPSGKMDCIDLGYGFFLIKFSFKEDHARVLKGGPWLVGGHYLSIRGWEPNFRPENANLSSVVVWVDLPGLPIEYYELSVLRDIRKVIGPVLCIDTHTASETRACFAWLCVQVNFDESIVKLVKVGGIDQPVRYEGISSLYFSCDRVGHKAEGCPYKTRLLEKSAMAETRDEGPRSQETREKEEFEPSAFGPWVFVA
nr:uncharacterized protein CFP56_51153 [Quercus suber]